MRNSSRILSFILSFILTFILTVSQISVPAYAAGSVSGSVSGNTVLSDSGIEAMLSAGDYAPGEVLVLLENDAKKESLRYLYPPFRLLIL